MRGLRVLAHVVLWSALALIAASFAGALHGLGDSLAVFRHWFAVAAAAAAMVLLRGRLRIATAALLAGFLVAAPIMAGWFGDWLGARSGTGATGGGRYSFYQKNLLYNGTDRQAIIDDILQATPDFVSMQEISDANLEIYEALAARYPSRILCSFRGVGRVAILSRFPLVDGQARCLGRQGPAAIRVRTPDGPVWALALHLSWPFPRPQAAQVAAMLPLLRALERPIVLGGDFNMVPWSNTMRQIQRATGTKRAGAVVFTFRHKLWPLWLPIDHVLVPSGRGRLERRPLAGSDHYGILLRFDL